MYNDNMKKWIIQTARCWEDIEDIIPMTGVETVDQDHRQLTEYALELNKLINRLSIDGLSMDKIKEELRILNDLYNYTHVHFAREEKILEAHKNPYLETQRKTHAEILDMLQNIIDDFKHGKISISGNLKLSIVEWLVNHVSDLDYKTFQTESFKEIILGAKSWSEIETLVKKVGVEIVDNDHMVITSRALEFINYLDELNECGAFLKKIDEVKKMFKDLETLFVEHFDHEEDLLLRINLKDEFNQNGLHKEFMGIFRSYLNEVKLKNKIDICDFKDKILNWWINHINNVDYKTFHLSKWLKVLIKSSVSVDDISWVIIKTGVSEVDNQHLELVKIVVKNRHLFEEGEEVETGEVGKLFDTIFSYVKVHFETEEKIMRERSLQLGLSTDNLENHFKEHGRVIQRFLQLKNYIMGGVLVPSTKLLDEVLDIWINHTNYTDIVSFRHFDIEKAVKNEQN